MLVNEFALLERDLFELEGRRSMRQKLLLLPPMGLGDGSGRGYGVGDRRSDAKCWLEYRS